MPTGWRILMATKRLYYVNQYLWETDAVVVRCEPCKDGWGVVLDRTVFYPTGGGQPCDLGTIDGVSVSDVSEVGDDVLHRCEAPLPVGARVHCRVDRARRFSLMQQHSGEHLVSGIVHSRFGFENVGFHMGKDVITIDFSGELTAEQLREVELAANTAVWQNITTDIFFPDAETLPTLPYRSKKALSGAVRLVRFGEIDLCACCGLHVAHTGEIGLIKLLSSTRFHGGSRIELLCGERALMWLNRIYDQNAEISALLSAKPMETAAAVRRLSEECAAASYRAVQAENRLFARIAAEYADSGNVLLFEDAMPADALRRLTDAVLRQCGGICAVFSGENGNYKYAVGTLEGDLRELVRALNAQLNGRGGGKPAFAQGSVAASRAEISAFFDGFRKEKCE